MFKNAEKTIASIKEAPVVQTIVDIPKVAVVPHAGVVGAQRLAVQVAFTQYNGRVSGAYANTLSDKAHRLEVTRVCEYGFMTDDQMAWMQTRIGRKEEDRELRPDGRHSLLMWKRGPGGIDLKPWFAMYRETAKAIAWCMQEVKRTDGAEQYALLMLVDCSKWELVHPTNGEHSAYYQASITAMMDLEIVRLTPPPLLDGFGDNNFDSADYYEED